MRRIIALVVTLTASAVMVSCPEAAEDYQPERIIAMERTALDRWGKGDPQGYLETFARDISYFDPTQEKRVDGLEAMQGLLVPLSGKIRIDRYEMINPRVQGHGDIAVLTFNLVTEGPRPGDAGKITARWNSTEIYRRVEGNWEIIHSHWSYINQEVKQTVVGSRRP